MHDQKQFTDTICKTFGLKGITPNSFVYVVNCILIGIVMVKVPGRKAYKLFFTIFPLWEASLKECLNTPMFQKAIVDTKNMDIYLPENMAEEDSSFTIHQCTLQIPFVPARDFSHKEIIDFLYDQTITNSSISGNFVMRMKIYKLIYNIALIGNDYESASNVIKEISQRINQWDDAIFKYWYGDKKSYLESLQDYSSNKLTLQKNIQNNLQNSKISKLPKHYFSDSLCKRN